MPWYDVRMHEIPLSVISHVLQNISSPAALIGSLNLAVQGIDISFADVDFLTDDQGVEEFARLVGAKPTSTYGFLECWGEYEGVAVNATSYQNNSLRQPLTKNKVRVVSVQGERINCLSLETELMFYEKAGREKDIKKVDLIRSHLARV